MAGKTERPAYDPPGAVNGAPLEESLHRLAHLATEVTGGEARTAFHLADPEGTRLRPVRGAGDMPASYLEQVDGLLIGEESLACGLAVATGEPVVTRDICEEPRWRPWLSMAEEHDYRACWSFPIETRNGKAVGTFAMYFRTPREATPRDLALAEMVTQSAAVIIASHTEAEERIRAEEALRESQARLAAELSSARLLQRISTSLIPEQRPEALYDHVLDAAMELMEADAASLQMLEASSESLVLLASRNLHPQSQAYWRTVDPGKESACGLFLRSKKREMIADVEACESLAGTGDLEKFRRAGVRAVQTTPLVSRSGGLIGAISTHWREPRRLSEGDFGVFDVLARQAADLIDRSQAEAALAAELAAMNRLRELSDRLLSPADLPAALGEVLETAIALHAADRGTVQVYDPSLDGLRYAATRGFDMAALGAVPPVDRDFHSTCAAAVRTGEPVLIPDIPADPRFADHAATAAALDYRAAFSFPLTTRRGEFLGVLAVHFRDRHEPSERELRWAGLYAPMAAHLIERQRAESTLRESEEQFRRALEEAPIPVIMHAEDGQVLQISRTWTELTGYALEDVPTLEAWLTRAYGEGADAVREHMHGLFAGGRLSLNAEFPVRTRSGEVRHWSFSASSPGALRDGRRFIVGMAVDITERQRAEAAVRESEARFRTLSDAVPQVIWTNDAAGRAVHFNQRWFEYTGLSYEESAGPGWQAVVHPEDAPASRERWQQSLSTGEAFDAEYRLRRRDGCYRWHLARNIPLKDASGQVTGWFGSATDIEDLKRAEAGLRESEERFRRVLEQVPVGVGTFDREGQWISRNAIFRQWVTRMPSMDPAAVGRWQAWAADGTPVPPSEWPGARALRGEVVSPGLDFLLTLEDGSERWIRVSSAPYRDAEGKITGALTVSEDITERRRAEEALREAMEAVARANAELEQRVRERTRELQQVSELRQELLRRLVSAQEEERGRISRDLHDDTGQQVTGLLLGLDRLMKSPAAADPHTRSAIEALQALAADVAEKSHRLAVTLRPTVLDDMGLVPALAQYGRDWSRWTDLPVEVEAIGLEERLPREIETTVYRVTQEALTNVLRHARQDGGAQATRVSVLIRRRADEVVTVIEDDGPGFDAEAVLNLPPGQRRLGIFGMQERARLAGGTLTIESEPGAGTAVYLRLPLPGDGASDA